MRVTNHLDLDQNSLIRAVMHPVTSNPTTPVDGQVWYRSDTDRIMCQVNGAAQSLAFLSEISGSTNLAYTPAAGNGVVTSDTGTDATIPAGDGTNAGLLIPAQFNKLAALSGTNTGDEPSATDTAEGVVELATIAETQAGTDATRAVTPDGLQGVTDVSGMAWVIDEDSMVTNSAARVPTQQSVKAYVDAAVTSSMDYKGGYNASTDTPSLDDGTPIAGIRVGDVYTVTSGGTFFTEAVEVGDTLIAEIDSALVLADWTIVNRNIDAASSTVAGIVELATAAEVDTGTDTTRAVTPEALASSGYPRKFAVDVGTGAANPIVITHNLGTKDVVVSLRQLSDDAHVLFDVVSTSTNSVTLTFAVIPTSAQYRAVVIG